jgi:hypothetical protein
MNILMLMWKCQGSLAGNALWLAEVREKQAKNIEVCQILASKKPTLNKPNARISANRC